ncbi:hypothetical protein HIM_06176 [Hirsutella minnesotensis 3608]|uniref:Laccase-2 n=1 Tax=Hirsutella minnesotensis 3608 TaxID=1043627 RepID=A0A0F7ZJG2_9HYPO|nr:hypothetical protein HIM_06176 [Hirsutella minnesotensis 3608]
MVQLGAVVFSACLLRAASALVARGPQPAPGPCAGNSPSTRNEWCNYSIATDYSREAPDTGVTREYWLELTNVNVALDGVPRPAMAINGSIPGPTIFADWGDTVVVHVKNSLTTSNNGTSMHFHGIRQHFTNSNDGVVSVTQCPTPKGETVKYTWKATQYGSSWYHSHFGLQAWEGVFGGIVINGPATANYDVDLGPVFLNDWDHSTADELATAHKSALLPPIQANGLINGTNVFGNVGKRLNIRFEAGKSYRMRLINAALETHFKFMIDNHEMKVIAADFVPINPYTTNVLDLTMGQRYDIIVTANQAANGKNFWMRAVPQVLCTWLNGSGDNIKAIVHYDDKPDEPRTLPPLFLPGCDDDTSKLVPWVRADARSPDQTVSETAIILKKGQYFEWTLNNTSLKTEWGNPTASKVLAGNATFQREEAIIDLPTPNTMFYLVINNPLPNPHPIHLHGHDFFVLSQGLGWYLGNGLKMQNPPRRDTALLPSSGHLVIGFETDNPGVWLLHCHIGFHAVEGFALQFVERKSEIPALYDRERLDDGCKAWNTFQTTKGIMQDDSGI